MNNKMLDFVFGKGPTKSKIKFWVFMINVRTKWKNFLYRAKGPVENVITWVSETDVTFQCDTVTMVSFRKVLTRFGIPVGRVRYGYVVNADMTHVYETINPQEAVLSYRDDKARITRCNMLGLQLEAELELIRARKNKAIKR